jgi:CxxC motif-containing protein
MEEVGMTKYRWIFCALCFLILSGSVVLFGSEVDKIVEQNILAAGGKENLSRIQNYVFRYGPTTYYLSTDGLMKLTEGRAPIITEVILIEKDQVKRNCFNNISEYRGLQKSIYQCLARLRAGLFTLSHFKGQLKLHGLKSFGPQKFYMLSTNLDDLEVEFYLDSEDMLLKRLVLKGYDEEQNRLEENHDFGSYQEIEGVKIPTAWFASQVGIRGSSVEVSDVKVNQPLEKDFFSNLDVNVGDVEIGLGSLKGNIVQSSFRRNILTIGTNWTEECIGKASFKAGDILILQLADTEHEIVFHESFPPRNELGPGSKFMTPNQRGENYLIYLISPEFSQLAEQLEPLSIIRIKKK